MKRLSLLVMCILCIPFLTGCGVAAVGMGVYTQVQVDTLKELLIEKGVITNEEFNTKQSQVLENQEKQRKAAGKQSGTELEN